MISITFPDGYSFMAVERDIRPRAYRLSTGETLVGAVDSDLGQLLKYLEVLAILAISNRQFLIELTAAKMVRRSDETQLFVHCDGTVYVRQFAALWVEQRHYYYKPTELFTEVHPI